MWPIGDSLDKAVLDRIPMAVTDVWSKVLLVADQVLPLTPLPQADLAPLAPRGAWYGRHPMTHCDADRPLDQVPAHRLAGIARWQGPDHVVVIGQHHDRVDNAGYRANPRAFWNIRNHGVLPSQAFGQNDPDTPAIVRSGCGIRMVTRPSALVTEAMPAGEPFGFAG